MRQTSENFSHTKFHYRPSWGIRVVPLGRTEVKKPVIAICNLARAPTKCIIECVELSVNLINSICLKMVYYVYEKCLKWNIPKTLCYSKLSDLQRI